MDGYQFGDCVVDVGSVEEVGLDIVRHFCFVYFTGSGALS